MLIRRIEIENFLSYYDKNIFEFDEGPTIIIGQNNTGKSKLFDAFNWVLYNRAFKTEEEKWYLTRDWGAEIINNLAKKESTTGNTVECSVSILFIDEEENKYYLTREYSIKKIGKKDWDVAKNSELSLTVTDSITNNTNTYYDKDADEQLYSLFPENLSKYFLFQGENISQIMSLNNRSAFNKALTDLSRIEVFERAQRYTSKVLKKIKKEFENKDDVDKELQEKKKRLSEEIDKLTEDLAIQDELFENTCKERDIAKAVYDKKNEELKKNEECAVILREIDYLKKQQQSKNELRQNLLDAQKKDIFDRWMYAGTENIIKGFLNFYKKNKVEKKIPEPIRQEFIKEMLEDQVCKVCGNAAPKGSNEYKKIQGYLNDKALDQEIELINQLSLVADTMFEKVCSISSEIKTFYNKSNSIDIQIKDLQIKIKAKEEELRTIIPADVSEDEIKSKNFAQLQRDRDNAKNDCDKYKLKMEQISFKKEYMRQQLHEKKEKYDSIVESSSNIIEKQRFVLAEKINSSVTQFYTVFLKKLISDIEKETNTYFRKMTEKNIALSGQVKVDYENREVYPVDEAENRLQNINQANKISLQIAFVAAILSVSNKFWRTYFPFVSDAPISALGGNNKLTAVETMIDIFNQSIIVLKDDAVTDDPDSMRNDLIRNMIQNNNHIKNAYELRMNGETLDEQCTNIIKLK